MTTESTGPAEKTRQQLQPRSLLRHRSIGLDRAELSPGRACHFCALAYSVCTSRRWAPPEPSLLVQPLCAISRKPQLFGKSAVLRVRQSASQAYISEALRGSPHGLTLRSAAKGQ